MNAKVRPACPQPGDPASPAHRLPAPEKQAPLPPPQPRKASTLQPTRRCPSSAPPCPILGPLLPPSPAAPPPQGQCVGIAFQSLTGNTAQSVGYVIPPAVVRHFLDDVRRNRQYTGFPSLVSGHGHGPYHRGAGPAHGVVARGQQSLAIPYLPHRAGAGVARGQHCCPLHSRRLSLFPDAAPPPRPRPQNVVWQEMDSKALKRAYQMQPHQKGVLVRRRRRPCGTLTPSAASSGPAGEQPGLAPPGGLPGRAAPPAADCNIRNTPAPCRRRAAARAGALGDARVARGLCAAPRRHRAAHRRPGCGQRRHGALQARRARGLQVSGEGVVGYAVGG